MAAGIHLRPDNRDTPRHDVRDDYEALNSSLGADTKRLESARNRITTLFSRPLDRRDKISATNLLKSLEHLLGNEADWTLLVRSLWRTLNECFQNRQESIEHEETWLILAGYFLRPGFGAKGDASRINELWKIHTDGLEYPGKRNQLQLYILWRRVAGGLADERQESILAPAMPRAVRQPTCRPSSSGSPDRSKESAWPPKPN